MNEIRRNEPCVYFISDGQGHCKIGVASDIYSRFNTIQVGSAFELTIKHLIYTQDLKEAYETESDYHELLKNSNVRGEWFNETAVDNILSGKNVDGTEVKYLSDIYAEEFKFGDLVTMFLIAADTETEQAYLEEYEKSIPDYIKQFYKQTGKNPADGWRRLHTKRGSRFTTA